MSGPAVFSTIHWVGVGFISLWFLGSSMKEGMWNNALLCFNAFISGMIAWPLGWALLQLGVNMAKPDPGDPYIPLGIFMVAEWAAFIVCYLVLTTCTDYLSSVRLAFHPVANSIGSFIFICGLSFALFIFECCGIIAVHVAAG